ncbi:uncharacterized protein LOC108100726 [Drosophila ficusphila]|uniref:uncharacterized protein LOC108100726 n=1 Tax=Drosophila ficusphila TaxID=30025 RepID=UPI0007E81006|nr:uncharacterized protein LOC108100726 [Drosophila ficusphila]
MDSKVLLHCVVLFNVILARKSYHNDNHYEVVGVDCNENEAVSCMLIKCQDTKFCPPENFCYNPKCVCRKGFRRLGNSCVPKHNSWLLKESALQSALLEIPYRELFF